MNVKQFLGATVLLLASVAHATSVTLPGGNLGELSAYPSQFERTSTSQEFEPFGATYHFTLTADSTVYGTVNALSELLGEPTSPFLFLSAAIDGEALQTLPSSTSLSFSKEGLSSGAHWLTVAGIAMPGTTAFTGSLYVLAPSSQAQTEVSQVPEPASVALVLAGLGIVGSLSARRRAA